MRDGEPMMLVAAATASLALLQAAANPNPELKSYTATARLSATLHVAIPIHETYNGTVYYLKPKRKIAFQNVPGPLSRFKDMAASAPSYEEVAEEYTITPLSDNGSESAYSLVPKKAGSRVKSLNVTVNDASELVTHTQWLYTNGGELDVDQSYMKVGGFELPLSDKIAARFPGYNVDATLSFSDYMPNAKVSPSVFASPNS
ncbi:MAG: hypothetical protein JO190_11890 [Candidatus Eremiobacteraeota bacterium]|nr:hypothetical protein [Candidatus Eremiobacteraeota bacterium]